MNEAKFKKFTFVDNRSMEVIVIYYGTGKSAGIEIDKFIDWILNKAVRKLSDNIILLTRTFGENHNRDAFFNEEESTFVMMIDYDLLREYVAMLNERMILSSDKDN